MSIGLLKKSKWVIEPLGASEGIKQVSPEGEVMDISDLYIKMCEKAWEIQALREYDKPYQGGDWWISRRWLDAVPCAWRAFRGMDDIWLPTQAQLQGMVFKNTNNRVPMLVHAFFDYWNENGIPAFWSMEELWLAFIYKELYSKVWDSEKEDWVEVTEVHQTH